MAGAYNISLFKMNLNRPSISPVPSAYHRRTIITSVAQNQSYLDSIHSDIDSYLRKAIATREPVSISKSMHHLAFTPPKTTASTLCVAACELVGGYREDAVVAASAIHLMHASIYSREHILLTGRGRAKPETQPEREIPLTFGSKIELLIGNGILPFGFELLARSISPTRNNSNKILRVIKEITQAMGAQGMVNGQDNEPEFDQLTSQRSLRLHECGAACGAILGGGSEEEIESLKRYGVYIGKIQGLLSEKSRNEGGKMKLAENWSDLALKELEYFDSEKVDQISTIVESQKIRLDLMRIFYA